MGKRVSKRKVLALAGIASLVAWPVIAAAPAMASSAGGTSGASGTTVLQASLQPVPDSMVHGSGTATVTVTGTMLQVTIRATGLDPTTAAGLPAHAQHIHIGGTHSCPTAAAATDHNGHQAISVKDGLPSYGPIKVALTTSGDTSANSGLALKRFPATPDGTESYTRSITVSSAVAQQIADGQGVVVIHGIDYLHNGSYKDLGKADVDPSLPLEGTAPALCGELNAMPAGGAPTGGGSTSGVQDEGLLALGGGMLLVAAGALAYRRRLTATQKQK